MCHVLHIKIILWTNGIHVELFSTSNEGFISMVLLVLLQVQGNRNILGQMTTDELMPLQQASCCHKQPCCYWLILSWLLFEEGIREQKRLENFPCRATVPHLIPSNRDKNSNEKYRPCYLHFNNSSGAIVIYWEIRFYFIYNSIINHSLVLVYIKHLLCIKLCVMDYFVKDLTSSGRAYIPPRNIVTRSNSITVELKGHPNYFISLEFYCIEYA